jgi:hypothetical protein
MLFVQVFSWTHLPTLIILPFLKNYEGMYREQNWTFVPGRNHTGIGRLW